MAATAPDSDALRPLDRGDLDLLRAWHNQADVRAGTFAFPFPASVEAEAEWYDRNVAAGDGRNAVFGITADGGDPAKIVGLAMLRQIDWISRSAWFGVFVAAPEARGKGRARAATEALLAFGFDDLGLNRVALEVAASNTGAIALYESVGFAREGTMRQARFIDGAFVDVHLYALLRGDRTKAATRGAT